MALSRIEQKISETYSELGVDSSLVNYLVDLSKGRLVGEEHEWFYKLFLDRSTPRKIKNTEDVRSMLQSFWWVEDDDIIQELLMLLCKYKRKTKSDYIFMSFMGWQLRDWLLIQEVIYRDHRPGWDENYRQHLLEIEDNKKDINNREGLITFQQVLDAVEFDLFTGYFMYLYYESGFTLGEISQILQVCERQARRHNRRIKKKLMEHFNEKSTNPSRHC